jgi:hypothetical protein
MSFEKAKRLAEMGFHVFPLLTDSKKPGIADFPNKATRDLTQMQRWFNGPSYNIGISTSRYEDDYGLIVVDVDNKGDKRGSDRVFELELEGKELPDTYTQQTPTGGLHLVYKAPVAMKQGVNVLGYGLDIRSSGGYIVGSGSVLDDEPYTDNELPVVDAPQWLLNSLEHRGEKQHVEHDAPAIQVDQERAKKEAIEYLKTAPEGIAGNNRSNNGYIVACRLKDIGVLRDGIAQLMLEHWYDGCGLDIDRLEYFVDCAFKHGLSTPGSAALEAQFKQVDVDDHNNLLAPVRELNKKYAMIEIAGKVRILKETVDAYGKPIIELMPVMDFRNSLLGKTINPSGKKEVELADFWLSAKDKRKYEGLCFKPDDEDCHGYYNFWRGFSCEPYTSVHEATEEEHKVVNRFFEHLLKNVCNEDEALAGWLTAWFAHALQRPYEKPLVACVFRGGKGVGKNTLIEAVGNLIKDHFIVADNSRYLISTFNAHFEKNLMICFDEAFWSGDKKAEGTLKGLITGAYHNIERKGLEMTRVKNLTRVAIIGNEKWLVPASSDERRYAVFNVGDGRKQDKAFFKSIADGLEAGANRLLLRVLLDFDLSKYDVNEAPKTEALLDQKHSSLDTFEEWWLDSLTLGYISGHEFGEDWPDKIRAQDLFDAYVKHLKAHNVRARTLSQKDFYFKFADLTKLKKKVLTVDGGRCNCFELGILADARKAWAEYIGQNVEWETSCT